MEQEIFKSLFKIPIKEAVKEAMQELENEKTVLGTYTYSDASRMLKVSFNTIKRYCEQGILKTTINKRIPGSEIRRYLQLEESKEIQPRKRG